MRRALIPTLKLALLLALLPARLAAADWPQFRGPDRDGRSAETGLLTSWPAGGPEVLWRIELGEGYSGISVVGDRLFTLYATSSGEYLAAFDRRDGRQLWRLRLDDRYRDGQGNGPRSTPTVDGEVVYAFGARSVLVAAAAADGRELWRRDLKQTVGARPPQWGASTSPLVEGELLIVDAGGAPDASVVALDRRTGETVWTGGSDKAGYSSPLAVTVGGVRQVLLFTGTRLVSVAPADGKVLWKRGWRTSYDVNAAVPVFIPPDRVFVASGYDTGGALLRIRVAGGRTSAEELWSSRGMKNQFSSSVYLDGHLYGFDNSILKCLDAASGEERWKARGFGHGSLTYADGRLIVLGDRGRLALVEATPEAYREKAAFEVWSAKSWTVPTLADGRLYLRNEREMLALKVGG